MKTPIFKAQTEWVKPTEFPDLRHADEIAIDLETHDPELKKLCMMCVGLEPWGLNLMVDYMTQ